LSNPLGWDVSFEHNYNKKQEYLDMVHLPLSNKEKEYQFMDVFELLTMIMIIRRETIHFAIKNDQIHLLNINND
jgi:hypothetical protein